jgi:hypothetical protein
MQLQIWSKKDLQECWDAYELVTQLLHEKKTLTSTPHLCVHQVREIWSDSGIWVAEDSVWRQSVRYQFRASVIGG